MSNDERPIEGHVASILTKSELVINRGARDGVEIGMRFKITDTKGIEVTDPTSGESLGSVQIAKTMVKIVLVEDQLSVGRTFREYKTGGLLLAGFGAPETRTETLASESGYAVDDLDPDAAAVAVGDLAIQVLSGDDPVVRPAR